MEDISASSLDADPTAPFTLNAPSGYHQTMRPLNRPVSWWGWHWQPPVPMSIVEIIGAGSMSARMAAMFWVGMERGASIIVAADPPSAGKTTTLSALLAFTPPETLVYFTRGQGETFALPPRTSRHPTYLLINEMSDHIPVYTWDEYARRAFELLAEGYSMATTMHADTVDGVIRQLNGELGIPRRQIANVTFVVPLYVGRGRETVRRVLQTALLLPNGNDLRIVELTRWHRDPDEFGVLANDRARESFATWAGLTPEALDFELDRREGFLQRLARNGITEIPEVSRAIERFYEEVLRAKEG